MPRSWTHRVDLDRIHSTWQGLPHGQRGAFLQSEADRIDITKSTLYRAMQDHFGKKRDGGGRTPQIPDDLIERIALKKGIHSEITKSNRELSTEDARQMLIEEGDDEAADWSVSAINDGLRRHGYRIPKVRRRWQADYALQLWQIDSSRSKYFQIEDPIWRDGRIADWACRVTDRELHYKANGVRIRTWIVQSIDDHSRLRHITYHAAPAESGMLWVEHMRHALQGDTSHPMHDAPEMMYFDQGAAGKSSEFSTMLDALDISTMESAPYNSEARGKVERGFRSLWQSFEASAATRLVSRLGRGCTVRLSRIQRMVQRYVEQERHKPHPWMPDQTRGAAYQQSIIKHARQVDEPWPRRVDADLLDHTLRTWTRVVTKAREVRVENIIFEAPAYAAGETVRVYRTANGQWLGELVTGYHKGGSFQLKPYNTAAVDRYERTLRESVYRDEVESAAKDILEETEVGIQAAKEQEVEDLMAGGGQGEDAPVPLRPDATPVQPTGPAADVAADADEPEEQRMPLLDVRATAGKRLRRMGASEGASKRMVRRLVAAGRLSAGMTRSEVISLLDEIQKLRATA